MTIPETSAAGQRRRRPAWPLLAAVAVPLTVYLAVAAAGYDGRPYLRGDCPYYFLTGDSLLADGDLDLGNQLPGEPSRYSGEVALDRRGRLVPKHPIALPGWRRRWACSWPERARRSCPEPYRRPGPGPALGTHHRPAARRLSPGRGLEADRPRPALCRDAAAGPQPPRIALSSAMLSRWPVSRAVTRPRIG